MVCHGFNRFLTKPYLFPVWINSQYFVHCFIINICLCKLLEGTVHLVIVVGQFVKEHFFMRFQVFIL